MKKKIYINRDYFTYFILYKQTKIFECLSQKVILLVYNMIYMKKFNNYIKPLIVIIFFIFSTRVYASIGTIDSNHYKVQICENVFCNKTSDSAINFGYFSSQPSRNITITDSELTGYLWGQSIGWAVLNCSNTSSGCSSSNGNFKVNNIQGQLSGYAWGENSGWINFGPFTNKSVTPITINSLGQFNGYAWSENFGWIKFDCTDPNSDFCVVTNWKPSTSTSPHPNGRPIPSDTPTNSIQPSNNIGVVNTNSSSSISNSVPKVIVQNKSTGNVTKINLPGIVNTIGVTPTKITQPKAICKAGQPIDVKIISGNSKVFMNTTPLYISIAKSSITFTHTFYMTVYSFFASLKNYIILTVYQIIRL